MAYKYPEGTEILCIKNGEPFVAGRIYTVYHSERWREAHGYRFKDVEWEEDPGWSQSFIESPDYFKKVEKKVTSWRKLIE